MPAARRRSSGGADRPATVSEQVETTQFRALVVVRLVVAVYAVALNATRWREFERPVLGWAVVDVRVPRPEVG